MTTDQPPAPPRPAPAAADVDRLDSATHDDPFAVLGPHCHDGQWTATVILPNVRRLEAVHAKGTTRLTRQGANSSVLSGPVPGPEYRLRAVGADATEWEFDDPYRFPPVIGEVDEHLFSEGTHRSLWTMLGAHPMRHMDTDGVHYAVWAPNARRVSVVGPFNGWDGRCHPMRRRGGTGVWELFIPGQGEGTLYKFEILDAGGHLRPHKADPVGFGAEHPPATASVVRDLAGYGWRDADWMAHRQARNAVDAPISIYEVHLGSWRRKDGGRMMSYKEAAEDLVEYAHDMGFTHLELMPVSEYPFDGSWGYQPVGLYAPTIRHGPPHEFRDLIDAAHARGLGVLLDWVPGHFPSDPHGLAQFDGTALYEHADPREGFHHDWNTLIYNYGRTEVRNFLVANALYWLKEYHLDGLRVDAVASMLYRDYSRAEGEWVPNIHGGRENLEAIAFLREMNTICYGEVPGIMNVAEESTSFPGISHPVDGGGVGFGYKWNMGWMNDTLRYIGQDPVYRKYDHNLMTFGLHYAFSENFILPISHDEVVHGKGSMLARMPGNDWERFANLRAYYGFMWGHPGKKLLFMGQEFAQPEEWSHDHGLNWDAAAQAPHAGIRNLVRDLNALYRRHPAMHQADTKPEGFEWIDGGDAEHSVLSWIRRGGPGAAPVAVICNFTPVERAGYRIGLPKAGHWREILNTDAAAYGGGDRGNLGWVEATPHEHHGQPASANVTLPPLSTIYLLLEK